MSRQETSRALLRAFADAARLIAGGFDPSNLTAVEVYGEHHSRRALIYQRAMRQAFASAYGH